MYTVQLCSGWAGQEKDTLWKCECRNSFKKCDDRPSEWLKGSGRRIKGLSAVLNFVYPSSG